MKTIWKIEGMSCGHCVAAVKSAIESVPGVDQVAVSLEPGRATVVGSPEPAAIAKAVEEEGYSAAEIGQES